MSIIVPIYNVARYLERCLDSIRNQSRGDFEAILVCRGDHDDMKICKKYVEMDQRFSLVTLRKKGPGRARNAGLGAASSEYIMFMDGDDTMNPNMVEKMLAPIEKDDSIDMVQCGINVFFEENFTCKYRDCDEIKKSDADYYKLKNTGKLVVTSDLFYNMNAAVQNKLFRKELINRYKVRYVDDLFAEDAYFVWCYFCICHNIFNIEDELCNYYRRKYSRMWGLFNKKFKACSL